MHMWVHVCVNETEAWAFCEDRGILGTWAALHFAPFLPLHFPSFIPPLFSFPSLSFSFIHSLHWESQWTQIFIDSTWKNMETAGQSV